MTDAAPKDPIFIVGTGRCGSTALHRLMTEHPHVSYLTRLQNKVPHNLRLHRFAMRLLDAPLPQGRVREALRPSEGWPFWELNAPGFSTPYRDLLAADVTVKTKDRLRRAFQGLVTTRRSRPLIKLTGWTRVGFIKEVFPDARIIHVIRHPCAVANSLLYVQWWKGWHGPSQWRWGPLDSRQEAVWRAYDQSYGVLALIQIHKIMNAYRQSLRLLPDETRADILEIKYDDLCGSTEASMKEVIDFCGLDWTAGYSAAIRRRPMRSTDFKWRRDFTDAQQAQLLGACRDLNLV